MFFTLYACLRNWRPFVAWPRAQAGDLRRALLPGLVVAVLGLLAHARQPGCAAGADEVVLPIVFPKRTASTATRDVFGLPEMQSRRTAPTSGRRAMATWARALRARVTDQFETSTASAARRARRHLRPHPHGHLASPKSARGARLAACA